MIVLSSITAPIIIIVAPTYISFNRYRLKVHAKHSLIFVSRGHGKHLFNVAISVMA